MAQELINVGNVANDGTGDPLRIAFEKINNNFSEMFSIPVAAGPNGSIQYNTITIATGAQAEASIASGIVTDITVTANGVNYISSDVPTVTITPAPGDLTGTGATAVAILDGSGGVANISITDGGANYTLPPVVEIETITNNILTGSANLVFDQTTNKVSVNANILPKVGGQINIGNATSPVTTMFVGQEGMNIGNIEIDESGNTLSFNVRVLPSQKANVVVNELNSQKVNFGETVTLNQLAVTTTDDTPNQVAFSIPVANFDSCLIDITSRDSGANSQTATISSSLINDGSGVRYVVYGTIISGNAIVTYDMDVAGGEARLLLNPLNDVNITHNINYKLVQ